MTRKRKKTTIITETDRLLILNKQSGAVEGWCDDCDDLVGMLRPEQALALAAFRLGAVYRSPELGKLRRPEESAESVQACLGSLLKPA